MLTADILPLSRLRQLPRPVNRDMRHPRYGRNLIRDHQRIDLHPFMPLVLVILGNPRAHVQRIPDACQPEVLHLASHVHPGWQDHVMRQRPVAAAQDRAGVDDPLGEVQPKVSRVSPMSCV